MSRELPIVIDGAIRPEASWITIALMCLPEDVQSAETVHDIFCVKALKMCAADDGSEPPESGFERRIYRDLQKASPEGITAGEILLRYIALGLHRPREKSMNKAQHLRWMELSQFGSIDIRTVRRHWEKYRNVAHLWAAASLIGDQHGERAASVFAEDINFVLQLSDFLLKQALALGAEISDPWVLPTDVPRQNMSIGVPPLTKAEDAWLASYKAPTFPGP